MPLRISPNSQAAAAVILSALFFTGAGALIKGLGDQVSLELIVFARNFVSFLLLLPWALRNGARHLATEQPALHGLRALFGLAAMYCSFYALTQLPLAQATLLTHTAPLYVPLIAAWWLRESLDRVLILAAMVGFAGIGFILKPAGGDSASTQALMVGLASGVFAACAFVTLRRMSRSEPPMRTVFYFTTIGTIVSACPLLVHWSAPPPETWLNLALVGVFATGGQTFLTLGYALAPAARVGPFNYSNVVFAALVGLLIWHEVPDGWALWGASLVFIAGAVVLRHRPRARVVSAG